MEIEITIGGKLDYIGKAELIHFAIYRSIEAAAVLETPLFSMNERGKMISRLKTLDSALWHATQDFRQGSTYRQRDKFDRLPFDEPFGSDPKRALRRGPSFLGDLATLEYRNFPAVSWAVRVAGIETIQITSLQTTNPLTAKGFMQGTAGLAFVIAAGFYGFQNVVMEPDKSKLRKFCLDISEVYAKELNVAAPDEGVIMASGNMLSQCLNSDIFHANPISVNLVSPE